jgi:hypothetical protein
MILEIVVFLLIAAVAAVVGVRIGMLVAPRVGRLTDRKGDDDDDAG